MFLTVELSADVSVLAATPKWKLTSLTGILDTPSSIAMNQQALEKGELNLTETSLYWEMRT